MYETFISPETSSQFLNQAECSCLLLVLSMPNKEIALYACSDWTIKSKYPYTQPVHAVIGSLISEYPGYSLISDRDSVHDCFF